MEKERIDEILESHGVVEVKYKNNPVWLECISTDKDGRIQVRVLKTDEHFFVDIEELEE